MVLLNLYVNLDLQYNLVNMVQMVDSVLVNYESQDVVSGVVSQRNYQVNYVKYNFQVVSIFLALVDDNGQPYVLYKMDLTDVMVLYSEMDNKTRKILNRIK